jgi:hypothetical protein
MMMWQDVGSTNRRVDLGTTSFSAQAVEEGEVVRQREREEEEVVEERW